MKKKALIVVNVGTPDFPEKKFVAKFLTEFLNDKRVINLNFFIRKILVNLIIIPLRKTNSTNLYEKLWTNEGSPILLYLNGLVEEINKIAPKNLSVFPAMRYGKPSLKNILEKINKDNFDQLIIFPLFPQYASSTSGTVAEFVFNFFKNKNVIPKITFHSQYFDNEFFINVFSEKIQTYSPETFDKIIFSFHGLPLNHIDEIHKNINQNDCNCKTEMPPHGKFCYKAACYQTARLIAEKLNLSPQKFTVAFQSRISKNWLSPFTDKVIIDAAKNGIKNILIVAPSFTADCLETTIEIEHEYAELFYKHGGQKLTLVKSLNADKNWAEAVLKIIEEN